MDTYKVFILFGTPLFFFSELNADKLCAARQIANKSVVCVCNSTYCDTIIKEPLAPGQYVVSKSSQNGLRFNKTKVDLQLLNNSVVKKPK